MAPKWGSALSLVMLCAMPSVPWFWPWALHGDLPHLGDLMMVVVVFSKLVAVAADFLTERAAVAMLGVVVIPERLTVVAGFLADIEAVTLVKVVVFVVICQAVADATGFVADLSLVVDPIEMACHMFSMSSLLGFSLVNLLQPYILSEPDVVLSMSLVFSHVVTFVAKGIGVCFGLALIGGGSLYVVRVSVVVAASVAVILP